MGEQVISKIQFRRGPHDQLDSITPDIGEPVFTTDTNKLFIGDNSTLRGLGIIDVCENDTMPDVQDIDVADTTLTFKNGILIGKGDRAWIPDVGYDVFADEGIVHPTIHTSGPSQYVQEIYTTINTDTTVGTSVLVRAIKHINGIVNSIRNGPGVWFQYRTRRDGNFDVLENNSVFATKSNNNHCSFQMQVYGQDQASNAQTLKKESFWAYWGSAECGGNHYDISDQVHLSMESTWRTPQSEANDGVWVFFNGINQWTWTSMSIFPYFYISYNGNAAANGDVFGQTQSQWSYLYQEDGKKYWKSFSSGGGDGEWYPHVRAGGTHATLNKPPGDLKDPTNNPEPGGVPGNPFGAAPVVSP